MEDDRTSFCSVRHWLRIARILSLSVEQEVMADPCTRPLYKQSLKLFVQLVRLSEDSALASIVHVSEDRDTSAIGPAIRDNCGRFRVWAENVGAHGTGRVSPQGSNPDEATGG